MVNNYLEKSLKRFLKRKIKITLGLVVAFMITGTALFAEEVDWIEEASRGVWLVGIGQNKNTEEFIWNLGEQKYQGLYVDGQTKKNIILTRKFEIKENGSILISFKGKEEYYKNANPDVVTETKPIEYEVTIDGKELGNKTIENILTAKINIEKATNWRENGNRENYNIGYNLTANSGNISAVKNGNVAVNSGTIAEGIVIPENEKSEKAGQIALNGGIIVNKGNIEVSNQNSTYIQYIGSGSTGYNYGIMTGVGMQTLQFADGGKGYNYGIIKGGNFAQKAVGENAGVYNYGIINNTQTGQYTANGASAYNYGIIINIGDRGQNSDGSSCQYNYGLIINNGITGQGAAKENWNFGIIANNGDYGQFRGKENWNLGIIANNGSAGQDVFGDLKAYNFGTIINNGEKGQSVGGGAGVFNYGVIANKGNYGQYEYNNFIDTICNYGMIANTGNSGQYLNGSNKSVAYNYGEIKNTGNNGIDIQKIK